MRDVGLHRGDAVRVRSAAEILASLDDEGALDALPFMPEMVPYCGRQFTVDRRADKVCDTISNNLQSRRVRNAVLLDDLRCDGSGHGGCQAECRFYWNEGWLRLLDEGSEPAVANPSADSAATAALVERVARNAQRPAEGSAIRYRCQATEMVAASDALSTTDPRPYLRELTTRNVSARTFARVMSHAVVMQPLHKAGLLKMPPLKGPLPTSPVSAPLDLRPGEWVRVKAPEAIRETLTDKGANRGLWFDREMLARCGQVLQVRRRVTKIIDERTGEMIDLRSDCIALEHGVCHAELSTGRFFCPREIYSYWRECWLERVEPPARAASPRH